MALYKQITIITLSLRAEIGRWVDIPFIGPELSMQCLLAASLIQCNIGETTRILGS